MIGTPNLMPEAPNLASTPQSLQSDGVHVLSDVLRRLHLASAIFLRGEFSAPWAFASVDVATFCSIVRPQANRLVLFHLAVEGSFSIALETGEQAIARAGDAVVLPYCDMHKMGFPADAEPVPIAQLLPMPPWSEMPVVRHGGGGPPTRILCGYLHCDDLLFNPLLRALPRLILVRPSSDRAAQWREASLRYTLEQSEAGPGGNELASRLAELVLIDCLRQYAEGVEASDSSWLAALADPVLARTLMLIHDEPAEPWTVERLARRVAVSRSILADRFTRTLGVSPMRYVAQWRAQLAADLLRANSELGLSAIARRVGYESEAAFSRAFKRQLGMSPAAWRAAR
jgi:AraC family transcriptional regulator, alkane utilization regulator